MVGRLRAGACSPPQLAALAARSRSSPPAINTAAPTACPHTAQVWAMKSYTKTVPLYVQTVRQATVSQIAPFLDPGQDVVVSMEQTRMR